MSDALTPLRHAYGVEPAGPVPAPGEPGHAELTALRQMRDALDTLPALAPEASATEAVHDYAASAEVALLRSTAEAIDHAVRRQRRAPSADVLAAVTARAAEAATLDTPPRLGADDEAALLDQSLAALDRLPTTRPDADVIARVLAHAGAAGPLAAVQHVYADGPEPLTEVGAVEAQILRQTGDVFDRATRSRPQPRPSEATVAAVLARAAEATAVEPDRLGAESPVEAALLDQSLSALDRLPVARPEAATVAAVLAHAAEAAPTARPARRAPDRAAARPARRRRTGTWAGVGGLLVAALVAVVALPSLLTSEPDLAPEAAQFIASDAVADDAEALEEEVVAPEADVEPEAPAPASASPALAASAAIASAVPPVVERRRTSGPSAPPSVAQAQFVRQEVPVAEADLAGAAAALSASEPAPSWDAGDDVRTLSLRLRDLETQGLAWDAPTEVGGTPVLTSPAATPGIQAVREGAAPPPPAVPDSTRQQR